VIKLFYNASYPQVSNRILRSTSGFGAMDELLPWTNYVASLTLTAGTNIQYLQIDFQGTLNGPYLLVEEVRGLAAAGALIDVTAGYNLFFQRATATIDSQSGGGTWGDAVANAIDLNHASYLRGYGATNWFIVDLGKKYTVKNAAVGFYHGQSWGNILVEASPDKVSWATAYNKSTTVGSQILPFAMPHKARYFRVTTTGAGSSGACCEFELYAVTLPPAGSLITIR
jgi:hypothetical protein